MRCLFKWEVSLVEKLSTFRSIKYIGVLAKLQRGVGQEGGSSGEKVREAGEERAGSGSPEAAGTGRK